MGSILAGLGTLLNLFFSAAMHKMLSREQEHRNSCPCAFVADWIIGNTVRSGIAGTCTCAAAILGSGPFQRRKHGRRRHQAHGSLWIYYGRAERIYGNDCRSYPGSHDTESICKGIRKRICLSAIFKYRVSAGHAFIKSKVEEIKLKKILQNRIVIGLTCIILSLIICFGLTPMFNNALKSKVSIVRVSKDIKEGDQITKEMVTTVEAGGYNLPGNVVYLEEDVIGKYANTDLYPGDSILTSKLSDTPMLKNAYLSKLNGENRAISISIKSFAAGLSGKLEAGDIVTLIASDVGENRETLVPPELQYVEIIATTTSSLSLLVHIL